MDQVFDHEAAERVSLPQFTDSIDGFADRARSALLDRPFAYELLDIAIERQAAEASLGCKLRFKLGL